MQTWMGWFCLVLGGVLNVAALLYYLGTRGGGQPAHQRGAALANGGGAVLVLVGLLLLTNA